MYISGAGVYTCIIGIIIVNLAYSQDCPHRWHKNPNDPTSSSCYLMTNSIYRTWQDAQQFCKYMGGDLLKIDTVAEWNWLHSLISVYHRLDSHRVEWWIGLHDNPQSQFVWTDKTGINNQLPLQWYPGEPATYDHNKACVEIFIANNSTNTTGVIRHQDCSSQHSFVCERPISSPVWCDATNGWEDINGMCFKVMTRLLAWDDARSTCRSNNAELMMVKDQPAQDILYNMMELKRADMWIGLRAYQDSQGNITFRWGGPTGTPLQALPVYWGPVKPLPVVIRSNGSQACVEGNIVLAKPNVWSVSACAARRFSICQKPQGFCAAGWIQSQSKCYYMTTRTKMSWSAANDYCKQRGADLLQIKGSLAQQFINRNLVDLGLRRIDSIWLGLYDNGSDSGSWRWGDNSRFTFSPYVYNNFPNGHNPSNRPGQADCFTIFTDDTNGTWQIATDCMANKSFVCNIPISRAPKHPTPPHAAAVTGPTTTLAPVTWSNECGVNWILDSTTGYCYKFMDNTVKWSVARLACVILGGQLTSINTVHEQRFIADRLFGYKAPALWLGVNNLNTHNGYQWIDGSGFGYMNWAPGEPNNHGYKPEKCGEIVSGGPTVGRWNDVRCDAQRGYICKKTKPGFSTLPPWTLPTPPAGSKNGCPSNLWAGYNKQCFLFMHTRTSWLNARTYCRTHGHSLASIADENEQNFVFSQLGVIARKPDDRYDLYWIGLNDIDNQMRFSWTDFTHVTYTNWEAGEPDNAQTGRQDCVSMHKQTGTWQDAECDTPLSGFICKTPKMAILSTVPQMNPSQGCAVENSNASSLDSNWAM